jgi:hypothetical protein
MTIEDFDIVGSYNNQRFSTIDTDRSVNCFQYNDLMGKKKKSLINTSGLLNLNLSFVGANGGYRAQFVFNGDEYHVIGNKLYEISDIGTISFLGTLNTSVGYVGVDANTFQIIFVDGVNGYIWDTIAIKFIQITDSSFPVNPIDVTQLDGFFVVAAGGTNTFLLSSFEQGLVWGPATNLVTTNIGLVPNQLIVGASTIGGSTGTPNYQTGIPVSLTLGAGGSLAGTGLAVSTTYYTIFIDATHIELATTYANAIAGIFVPITGNLTPIVNLVSDGQLQQGAITTHPGTIVACRTLHRRLFLFSQSFTEVWENAGIGTNLPFRRNNSLLLEYGTPCLGSISVSFDMMCFQSQTRDGLGPVMQVTGTQAIPISNRGLDLQYSLYDSLQQMGDCRAFLLKENGLIFYRMNFTAANHTFVYNVSMSDPTQEETKFWHEEETLEGNRHPAQTHAYFMGKNYVGDYENPTMFILDRATYKNNGFPIHRTRVSRNIAIPTYQRIRIDRFQLDMLQGNVNEINNTYFDIDIITENNYDIVTESGLLLVAEQQLPVANPLQPYVYLSISKDGGQTFGYKTKQPMGLMGQRTFRTIWRKLGVIPRGQGLVVKIEFYDPIPFIVLGAAWGFEVLPE